MLYIKTNDLVLGIFSVYRVRNVHSDLLQLGEGSPRKDFLAGYLWV